ncbi:MAG TPA: hypothetical protein DCQ58_05660 [Saprospirales bacterium]|jgi:hypothetical protein|nr:hypothetical protein [Saprospirales bacterium]
MEEKKPRKTGKGGRKKANEAERKFKKTIRFNSTELNKAVKNSEKAGLDFSEFVRKLVLNPRIVIKQKDPQLVLKTQGQIMKIGININQMTRSLNNQYEQHYFTEIARKLDQIEKELSAIYEEISK